MCVEKSLILLLAAFYLFPRKFGLTAVNLNDHNVFKMCFINTAKSAFSWPKICRLSWFWAVKDTQKYMYIRAHSTPQIAQPITHHHHPIHFRFVPQTHTQTQTLHNIMRLTFIRLAGAAALQRLLPSVCSISCLVYIAIIARYISYIYSRLRLFWCCVFMCYMHLHEEIGTACVCVRVMDAIYVCRAGFIGSSGINPCSHFEYCVRSAIYFSKAIAGLSEAQWCNRRVYIVLLLLVEI